MVSTMAGVLDYINPSKKIELTTESQAMTNQSQMVLEGENGSLEGIAARLYRTIPSDQFRIDLSDWNITVERRGTYGFLDRVKDVKSFIGGLIFGNEDSPDSPYVPPIRAEKNPDSYAVTINHERLGNILSQTVTEALSQEPTIEDLIGSEEKFDRMYRILDRQSSSQDDEDWMRVKEQLEKATNYQQAVFIDIAWAVDKMTALDWTGYDSEDPFTDYRTRENGRTVLNDQGVKSNPLVLRASRLMQDKGFSFDDVMEDITNNRAIMGTYMSRLRKRFDKNRTSNRA